MYVDSLEHPEKYGDEVRSVLSDLVNTRRSPTDRERSMLDRAVVDFSSKPKPPSAPVQKAKPPVRRMDFNTPDFATQVGAESPEEESGIPGGQPRAFWWL